MGRALVNYEKAMKALWDGKMVRSENWEPDHFMYKEKPRVVVPKSIKFMSSIPDDVKVEFARRGKDIHHDNQFFYVNEKNQVVGITTNRLRHEDVVGMWEILEPTNG